VNPSIEKSSRKNQRERLLHLLQGAKGREVGLPEILSLGIAQYNSRLLDLRREGHSIKNRTERRDGKIYSWFRLMKPEPIERENSATSVRRPSVQQESQAIFPQFGDLAPSPERYPD
jgi:hypothetical protein